jgi:hypothetical protein
MLDYHDYGSDSDERFADEADPTWTDDDPLVRRLRAMTWAEIPPSVRERCWEDIKQRIEQRDMQRQDGNDDPEISCDRYGYTRRRDVCRVAIEPRIVTAQPRGFRPQSLAWAFR